MRKEDLLYRQRTQLSNSEPSFEDADYQDDMKVDPLTTTENMKRELSEIESRRKVRELEASQKKAEEEAKAERERIIAEVKRSETAATE